MKKIEKSSMQYHGIEPNLANITGLIYVLEIITRIGKNFPTIFLTLASLNVLLAANDFLANSIAFGILNSMFAASGFIFLIQLHQSKKIQSFDASHNGTNSRSFMEIKE